MMKELTIPEALGDEDGEAFFLQGHVEPPLAVLSVVTYHMSYTDAESGYELLLGGRTKFVPGAPASSRSWSEQIDHANALLNSVEHYWAKPDPENDERMIPCDWDDPEAEPLTRVRIA